MKYVEELKKYLIIEQKKKIRNGVYGYTQRMLAYNSNKIEGSTLTPEQTASLFETGTLDGTLIRAKDIEEMTGHFLMFNEMLKTYKDPLSQSLIKRYHKALKSGVFEDTANGYPIGEFKNRANIVGNIITASPENVPKEMDQLISWYSRQKVSLNTLAEFHIRYERIHPFQDGNGRTGRIILFKECLKNNLVPFIIEDDQRLVYYRALQNADELTKLFREEQNKYYNQTYDLVIPYTVRKEETEHSMP